MDCLLFMKYTTTHIACLWPCSPTSLCYIWIFQSAILTVKVPFVLLRLCRWNLSWMGAVLSSTCFSGMCMLSLVLVNTVFRIFFLPWHTYTHTQIYLTHIYVYISNLVDEHNFADAHDWRCTFTDTSTAGWWPDYKAGIAFKFACMPWCVCNHRCFPH